jgi:hypothetical protein
MGANRPLLLEEADHPQNQDRDLEKFLEDAAWMRK